MVSGRSVVLEWGPKRETLGQIVMVPLTPILCSLLPGQAGVHRTTEGPETTGARHGSSSFAKQAHPSPSQALS